MLQQYLDEFAVSSRSKPSRCSFVFIEREPLLLPRLAADFEIDIQVQKGTDNMLHYLPLVLNEEKSQESEENEVVDTWFLQEKGDFDCLRLIPSSSSSKV